MGFISQEKIATIAADTYANESLAYMTTGMIDRNDPSCEVEAACCKVPAYLDTGHTWQCTSVKASQHAVHECSTHATFMASWRSLTDGGMFDRVMSPQSPEAQAACCNT